MRTRAELERMLATLAQRLEREFGDGAGADLVLSMISGALARKAMEQIEAIIGGFSAEELMVAAKVVSEMSGSREKQ